jgi:hypothetical protein
VRLRTKLRLRGSDRGHGSRVRRDLTWPSTLGTAHGWTIVRIPAPEGDIAEAIEELAQAADAHGVTS